MIETFKLPINPTPPITLYEHHASPLAILSTKEEYLEWFYCNYIQIWCSKDFATNRGVAINYCDDGNDYYMKYFKCPFLWTHIVPNKYAANMSGGVIAFFKEALLDGYYVRAYLDIYYLPDNSYYCNTHYIGARLLYGFDDRSGNFLSLGYRNGHYNAAEIPYAMVEKAFYANPNEVDWQSQVMLDQYISNKYILDITEISQLIHDYTHASQRNLYKDNWEETECFGIATYKYIYEYFISLKENRTEFDVRPSHLIWEHKNVMNKRLRLLHDKGHLNTSILEGYDQLVGQALLIRNYFLKYKYTGQESILERVMNEVVEIEKKELELMLRIDDCLSQFLP